MSFGERSPDPVTGQGKMLTGVPRSAWEKIAEATDEGMRMQPWEAG